VSPARGYKISCEREIMTQGVIDARKVSINQYIIVRPKVDQTSSPELDMGPFF